MGFTGLMPFLSVMYTIVSMKNILDFTGARDDRVAVVSANHFCILLCIHKSRVVHFHAFYGCP